MNGVTKPEDGRTQRRVATTNKLLEAHAQLLRDGDLSPTAATISEKAGVSLRTLWTIFADMEDLVRTSTQIWAAKDAELHEPVDPDLPQAIRIAHFCDERQRRLEFIAPAARAASIRLHQSQVLRESRRDSLSELADVTEAVFAAELARADDPAGLRDRILTAASWDVWALLRDALGYSSARARTQIEEMIRAELTAAGLIKEL